MTRGAVCVKTRKGFVGVYHPYDSFPLGLGVQVFKEIKKWIKRKSLKDFCRELLKYDDWRNFLNRGYCMFCGKKNVGQANCIQVKVYDREDKEILRNIRLFGVPDPECRYHHHGDISFKITHENADKACIEWMYLINTRRRVLEVYYSNDKVGEVKLSLDVNKAIDVLEKIQGEVYRS
ncbi:MAG: hypothetical protein QXS37_05190 [Candidatus Aenigmatarchaeota archaeon]